MSNLKFSVSAMIPSEWFHKLKNLTKSRRKKLHLPSHSVNTTKNLSSESKPLLYSSSSLLLSNRSHTSPRNSLLKIQTKRKSIYKPSLSPSSLYLNKRTCPASNQTKEWSKTHHLSIEDSCRSQKKKHQKRRRSSAKSQGIKLRVSSSKVQFLPRRNKSRHVVDSFAVIKRSIDPMKDFRESMVEMIIENNIRDSKDLVNLLACYLALNLVEYHDLIIEVFVQIWFDVINSTFASK